MSLIYTKTYASLSTILCLILLFSQSLSSSSGDQQPTVYEILRDYNFPMGLLPKGVLGYDLDQTTGKFSAFLNGTCSFSLERSYRLRYKSTIQGFISRGRLSSLEGVSVKLFFMWVDIFEVSRNGDDIEFYVGIGCAGFPIDDFVELPQCGCGLNCPKQRKASELSLSSS
ncbi:hypothetical protein P3X46_008550 [Hevea brasiliensis]|uniref:DUF538 domain-containing protein n=1 Tax=Hevea brasiliensis TaxID=3981 RepID=A0ABQ9MLL5_HEVBR|nr:uncharacterized protein At5g01610 [Hevea brasiliensis]KAJ9180283.1 hypothetical protein P3X46_008550 [Hevea brasiliensis]